MNEINALEIATSGKSQQPPGLGVWLASLGDDLGMEIEGLRPDASSPRLQGRGTERPGVDVLSVSVGTARGPSV